MYCDFTKLPKICTEVVLVPKPTQTQCTKQAVLSSLDLSGPGILSKFFYSANSTRVVTSNAYMETVHPDTPRTAERYRQTELSLSLTECFKTVGTVKAMTSHELPLWRSQYCLNLFVGLLNTGD